MARPDGFTQILEFRPGMRRWIEDAIESLIRLLGEIDGDDELEDGHDDEIAADAQPWLGSNAMVDHRPWGQSLTDNREYEDDREPEDWL